MLRVLGPFRVLEATPLTTRNSPRNAAAPASPDSDRSLLQCTRFLKGGQCRSGTAESHAEREAKQEAAPSMKRFAGFCVLYRFDPYF